MLIIFQLNITNLTKVRDNFAKTCNDSFRKHTAMHTSQDPFAFKSNIEVESPTKTTKPVFVTYISKMKDEQGE